MKTKKRGIYAALAAVLLITVGLIVSCIDPLGSSPSDNKDKPDEFVPPAGMGYVMLNFKEAGRTIRPATGSYTDVDDFNLFDVTFTAKNTAGNTTNRNGITYSVLTGPFTLNDDDYTVAVWAYFSPGAGYGKGDALAYGISAEFNVDDGIGTSAMVTLKEITADTYGGEGTFKLDLTNDDTANAATAITMTIVTWPDGDPLTPAISNANIFSTLDTYSKTLDPGIYLVTLNLSKSGTKSVSLSEILHIYQGFDSTYTRTLPPLNPNVYTISFYYNDTRSPDPETDTVTHGELIDEPSSPTHETDPLEYTLEGWYKEIGLSNKWNFATEYPIRNTSLYANWIPTGAHVTIQVGYTDGSEPLLKVYRSSDDVEIDVTQSSHYFSRATPISIYIEVDNAGNFTGDYEWDHDGTPFVEDGDRLTINLGSIGFLLPGTHTITVKNIDSSESNWISFKVNND